MLKKLIVLMMVVGFAGSTVQAQTKAVSRSPAGAPSDGPSLVIGTQPKIENPTFPEPKTLAEAKKQIAVIRDALLNNHIIWGIHCKSEEEQLIAYFTKTKSQNHIESSTKASGAKAATPKVTGGSAPSSPGAPHSTSGNAINH